MIEVDQQPKVATTNHKLNEIKQRSWLEETLTRLFRYRLSSISLAILVVLTLAAIFAPLISPYDRFEMDFSVRLRGPMLGHWLGTDESGRDLLSRIIWGGRITLGVAILAVVIASGVGIPWGMIAAHKGGVVDDVLMRICDVLMAFPSLVLALLIVTAMGPGFCRISY